MNVPTFRPSIPIMLGGQGERKTFRLAARYADHMNIITSFDELPHKVAVLKQRCEEIDRDPSTLALSVHIWTETASIPGQRRVDLLAGYREVGVDRVMGLDTGSATSDDALEAFADDAKQAGVELAQTSQV